jgi:hypothetical protein
MWFVEGGDRDWLAAVFKKKGEKWKLTYRFRYYRDDKAHDSSDEKKWWSFTANSDDDNNEQALCKSTDVVAGMTQEHFGLPGGKVHKIILKTDRAADVIAAMGREKWAHFREEAPGAKVESPTKESKP